MNVHHLLCTLRTTAARSASRARMLAAVLLCTACTWGTKASDIPWALGPTGAPAEVRLRNSDMLMQGDLLAVDSAGMLLRTTVISRIPWSAVRSLKLQGLGPLYRVSRGIPPSATTLERLSVVSQFPQGIGPEVLSKLLAATNQTSVEEIR